MTTPRIEEMVEEFMASFHWDAITSDNESNLKAVAKELTQALTKAKAEGIREERERIKYEYGHFNDEPSNCGATFVRDFDAGLSVK